MAHGSKRLESIDCYQRLRSMLLYGQLPPRDRLRELAWAQRLSAPRAAVREAMLLLAHEGLLQKGERGGYFVPVYEQQDLEHIWEARRTLEVTAIRRLVEQPLQEAAMSPLRETFDAMETMLKHGATLSFIEIDRRFHETLVSMCGNQHLIRVYRQAALPLILPGADIESAVKVAGPQTLREHRAIFEMILQGKAHDAARLLDQHLHGESVLVSP